MANEIDARQINKATWTKAFAKSGAEEIARIYAAQMLDPGQRGNLKLMGNDAMSNQSLWDSASTLFGPSNRLDQTNPSFVGAKAINGGGLIGDMVGAGPGWQFANGSKLRRDGLSQATQDMYDQAIRQDGQR